MPLSGDPDRSELDLATIFRDHRDALVLRGQDRIVVDRITACRTAALGGHLYRCRDCAYETPLYNGCRDRHCPKCHGPNLGSS